ncbi:fungal-specific transcription factor domain-containing protein [Spinellus fusiger]|nr:fungal-specific transcription factor domain-containing protein [Spinellus fusiger]
MEESAPSTPEPHEPHELQSLERSHAKKNKVARACDECRRKKVRCNGGQPCVRCRKALFQCFYSKVAPKRGPPKQYVETLEPRLRRVESVLDSLTLNPGDTSVSTDIHNALEKDYSYSGNTAYLPSTTVTTTATATTANNNNSSHNNSNSNNNSAVIGHSIENWSLKSLPKANDTAHYLSFVPLSNVYHSTAHTSSIAVSTIGQGLYIKEWKGRIDRIPSPAEPYVEGCFTALSDTEAALRTEQMVTSFINFELIQVYFDHIHPHFPILHKNNFQSSTKELSSLLLKTIYCLSTQWQETHQANTHRDSQSLSHRYYQEVCLLLDDYTDAPRLSTVQSLLLFIKYHEHTWKSGYVWRTRYYFQIIVRMVKDLGLMKELPRGLQVSPWKLEQRRRVYWVVYTYDIWLSLELGSQPSFNTAQCTVTYPSLQVEEVQQQPDQDDTLPHFHWIAKIVYIQGKVLQFLRNKYTVGHPLEEEEQVNKLRYETSDLGADMTTALGDLPENLNYTMSASQYTLSFAYVTYHTLLILLHRPYAFSKTTPHKDCYEQQKLCLLSALAITQMIEQAIQSGGVLCFEYMPRGVQQVIYCLSTTVTIYRAYCDLSGVDTNSAHQACKRSLEMIQQVLNTSAADSRHDMNSHIELVPRLQPVFWEEAHHHTSSMVPFYNEDIKENSMSAVSSPMMAIEDSKTSTGLYKAKQRHSMPMTPLKNDTQLSINSSFFPQLEGGYIKAEALMDPPPNGGFLSTRISTEVPEIPMTPRCKSQGHTPYAHHRRSAPLLDTAYQAYEQYQSLALHHQYYNRQPNQAPDTSYSQPTSPTVTYAAYGDSVHSRYPEQPMKYPSLAPSPFETAVTDIPNELSTVHSASKKTGSLKSSSQYPRRHTISSGSYPSDPNSSQTMASRPSLHAMAMRNTIQYQQIPAFNYYGSTLNSTYEESIDESDEMLQDMLLPTEPVMSDPSTGSMMSLLMEQTLPNVWDF